MTTPNSDSRGTRDRLLEEAAQVFAEQGYAGAGVREICQRAGANQAAINYHFGGKDGLYREVLVDCHNQVSHQRPMPRLEEEPDAPESVLRRWIHWNVQRLMASEHHHFGRLLARELHHPTPAFDELVKRSMRPTWEGMSKIVGAVLELPPEDPLTRRSCLSIFGQCLIYKTARPIMQRLLDCVPETPEEVEATAGHIAEFSLAGLRGLRAHLKGGRE